MVSTISTTKDSVLTLKRRGSSFASMSHQHKLQPFDIVANKDRQPVGASAGNNIGVDSNQAGTAGRSMGEDKRKAVLVARGVLKPQSDWSQYSATDPGTTSRNASSDFDLQEGVPKPGWTLFDSEKHSTTSVEGNAAEVSAMRQRRPVGSAAAQAQEERPIGRGGHADEGSRGKGSGKDGEEIKKKNATTSWIGEAFTKLPLSKIKIVIGKSCGRFRTQVRREQPLSIEIAFIIIVHNGDVW